MTMKIRFVPEMPSQGALIVPVLQDGLEGAALKAVDAKAGGAVLRGAKAAGFTGKSGQSLTIPGPDGLAEAVIVLMGLGKADTFSVPDAVKLGGKAFAAINGKYDHGALVLTDVTLGELSGADLAVPVAMGARLRSYTFDQYRVKTADKEKILMEGFALVTDAGDAATATFAQEDAVAGGVTVARDLVSEPPNILHPESFAERCQALESLGCTVTVLDEAKMAELGMGSLLGVGQGSVRESRLVAMEWKGGKPGDKPVAFIGKGVTFDTGGISLKPGAGMEDMKFDMGGAAAVTGAMHALAARKAKANVVGLIGLVENMPDGNAQRPSDIVTSMSGQTIEVLNTDAEGRLVLADVLTYAQKTYSPAVMVDLATLTGAIIVALAYEYGGMFTTDDALADALSVAGTQSGEELWRMPLGKAHDEMIKSDIADMKNIGGRDGGSSSAAAFLARFVEGDTPWAHLDIAGTAWTKKDQDHCPKGATGYGVRLLDQFIRNGYEG